MSNASKETADYDQSSLRFRRAEHGDRQAVLELCAAYRRADHQPEASSLVSAAIDAALAGDPLIHVFLVELLEASEQPGEHGSMLVGYLAVTLGFSIEAGGRDAFVDELYIQPSMQGRGLGKRALDFAEQLCRELSVKRVCLEVERANTRAKKLYDALGYRDHGRFLLSKPLL